MKLTYLCLDYKFYFVNILLKSKRQKGPKERKLQPSKERKDNYEMTCSGKAYGNKGHLQNWVKWVVRF